jgi:hypothetical protein
VAGTRYTGKLTNLRFFRLFREKWGKEIITLDTTFLLSVSDLQTLKSVNKTGSLTAQARVHHMKGNVRLAMDKV